MRVTRSGQVDRTTLPMERRRHSRGHGIHTKLARILGTFPARGSGTLATLKITIESDALGDADWRPGIAELLRLAASCQTIDVRRTAGSLRNGSSGPVKSEAAERRRLALTVPAVGEAFTLDVSELDDPESKLTERDENPGSNAISLALWGRPIFDLGEGSSDIEDVLHLHTHLRHERDLFVTTDEQMHSRRADLERLGIRVRRPAEALSEARAACESQPV